MFNGYDPNDIKRERMYWDLEKHWSECSGMDRRLAYAFYDDKYAYYTELAKQICRESKCEIHGCDPT